MHYKSGIILFFCFFSSLYSQGQTSETIISSRPGQAFVPQTTGKNIWQFQTGADHSGWRQDGDLDPSLSGWGYSLLLRYGILEDFELRSTIQVRRDQFETDLEETTSSGVSLWWLGARYNLVNGEGYKPSFGIQTEIKLNWVGEDYRQEDIAPKILLSHNQKLSDTFSLTTNWGLEWSGSDVGATGTYVINLAMTISDKVGTFIETYGGVADRDLDARFDTGLAYLMHDDLQLDLSLGYGANEGLRDYFVDIGCSWRIRP